MSNEHLSSGSPRADAVSSGELKPVLDRGLRDVGLAFLVALILMLPIAGGGGWIIYSQWAAKEAARREQINAALSHVRLVGAPAGPMLPVERAAHGRDLFVTVCAACHGATGTGVAGLGRNLTISPFVAGRDDRELHEFLVEGRPSAVPAMPPRGGRDDLTDADITDIVTYLRGLQDPRRLPALPEAKVVVAAVTEADKQSALAAAGGDAELAEYIASGAKLFSSTCIACHGAGGVGVAGNGKPLVNNTFVAGLDDDALLAFIQRGRDPSDKANTTGVGMPAKGGNPALSEDDLLDIIAYLRTLQGSGTKATGPKP